MFPTFFQRLPRFPQCTLLALALTALPAF